ncbi:MAG TPA: prepilin peptidase [Verrucomicrobiae bacterium]|nr:prepilin peptidase [Verrucomicrobiae bacterium]
MIAAVLVVLGLVFGSFVNALVWRIHEQAAETKKKNPNKKYLTQLSIKKGRSLCPHCKHELAAKDLVPLLSWLSLRGKCRYCGKPISAQYPLVEAVTAVLFVGSYRYWPHDLLFNHSAACPSPRLFHGVSWQADALFCLWLVLLTGLIALLVYDLRWFLLPDRLIYPLSIVAALMALISIANASKPLVAFANLILAIAIGGGIFYLLFQLSGGKWIGGGDVKLGWLLGLVVGTPGKALLFIFLASVLGTLISLPLLATHRLKRTSTIPFGPLLITGVIIAQIFGAGILHWYQHNFLNF